MNRYESPITVTSGQIIDQVSKEFVNELDEKIYQTIVTSEFDIDIDREELVKALQYDRNQYQKGYYDGYAEGYEDAMKGRRKRYEDYRTYSK